MVAKTISSQSISQIDKIISEPLILLQGTEEYLVESITKHILQKKMFSQTEIEIVTVNASSYEKNKIFELTSPSLFSEKKILVINKLENMNNDFLQDTLKYLDNPFPGTNLLFQHGGGNRGKQLVDKLKNLGTPKIDCSKLVKDSQKIDFVKNEFKNKKRNITNDATKALLNLFGSDLRQLAAACAQLISDINSSITIVEVETYYKGKAEITGFKVADAVVRGKFAESLQLLNYAVTNKTDVIIIVAALAAKFRNLAKVSEFMWDSNEKNSAEPQISSWQLEKLLEELKYWNLKNITKAYKKIAKTDLAVKGGKQSPIYELESTIKFVANLAKK